MRSNFQAFYVIRKNLSNNIVYFGNFSVIFQCCAVSFIENLTAESLNMPADEFENYMNGDVVSTSTWESALVICEVSFEFRFYFVIFLA